VTIHDVEMQPVDVIFDALDLGLQSGEVGGKK
jgi:hypothetical protein